MKNLKWFYLLAFIGGGLIVVALAYLLLRASGMWDRLTPDNGDKWIPHE